MKNVSLCDDKVFKIGGAFSRFMELFKFITVHPEVQLSVYDGVGMCAWNGGRINREVVPNTFQIDFYRRKDVPIFLTFSNPIIDLTDKVGNELLEQFHFGRNGIILMNDDLREYVAENFPKYRLIYSITGTGHLNIPMTDEDVTFYKDLETKYDLIVPRMEHIFDERFNELDQSKYEIMVNDNCLFNCKYYTAHFEAIAQFNTDGKTIDSDDAIDTEECWISDFDPSICSSYDCMDLNTDAVDRLYDRGVRHFKITGRELTAEEFNRELESMMRLQ